MSATFDSDMFARYFSHPIGCHIEKAPVMSIEGHCYEVTEYYIEDLHELGHVSSVFSNAKRCFRYGCCSIHITIIAKKILQEHCTCKLHSNLVSRSLV